MNVINDSGGTSGVGGGIGALPIPEDFPVPKWLEWIKDNGDLITGVLLGVAGGLLAIKLGMGLIKGLGFGLILAGIVILVKGILDFVKDPSWDNFLTILQGVALVVAGIAILMGAWIVALIALGVLLSLI